VTELWTNFKTTSFEAALEVWIMSQFGFLQFFAQFARKMRGDES
jgi:hypothetical protein